MEGCSHRDQGLDPAKALDDSGSLIVLGNVVFLKIEQVVKAIKELSWINLATVQESEDIERGKSTIDAKAKKRSRSLWGVVAYVMIHTVGFMRLIFWELSLMDNWICFFLDNSKRVLLMASFRSGLLPTKQ